MAIYHFSDIEKIKARRKMEEIKKKMFIKQVLKIYTR